jgi:hypothetical protein
MYSVYQHWDPLKVCIVGRSYAPEFYSFIKNTRVRSVMERIATETEEDYQKLIKLLQFFGVTVLRPNVNTDYEAVMGINGKILIPPMTPRDYSAMIGTTFYITGDCRSAMWEAWRGSDWPEKCPVNRIEYAGLSENIKKEIDDFDKTGTFDKTWSLNQFIDIWGTTVDHIGTTNPCIKNQNVNAAMITRIGKDLYFGTSPSDGDIITLKKTYSRMFPEYRCHVVNTGGHSDAVFCPVKPGLIVSLTDIPTYTETFPGWEVVYLPGQSWDAIPEFIKLKNKNRGKWWVPGEELNDEFTDFVESWLNHWVGYVEETVFDVNMLVIDEHNVVCNNYNKQVFGAFDRHGITPHVINFRHRYFWDGGLHCITSDIHREGVMKDYFPERG